MLRIFLIILVSATMTGCRESPSSVESQRQKTERTEDKSGNTDSSLVRFRDEAATRGISYEWPRQPRPMTALESFGSGCGFLDFDSDGWPDVVLVGNQQLALFQNFNGGHFHEVTRSANVVSVLERWTACAVGDHDSDGHIDLLATGFHCLALFRNQGDGTFQNQTTDAGLDPQNANHWGSSAGFIDLDNDEFLDLVLLNYVEFGPQVKQYCELSPGIFSGCPPKEYIPEQGEIWRNSGDHVWSQVARETMADTNGVGLVLACADLDGDRLQDVYIGNDGRLAELLHNQGGFKFENSGVASGVAIKGKGSVAAMAAMGADWGDFNRDGLLDLTVTDFQMASAAVFQNLGQLNFRDVGQTLGIHQATRNRLGFGAKWIDLDNDGWLDICYVNGHVYDNAAEVENADFRQPVQLLHSNQGKRFVDIVPQLAADVSRPLVGRGSATGDFDLDGRIDLLIVDFEGPVMLLRNQTISQNHWLSLELLSSSGNRFAYGAVVEANAKGQRWIGQVSPASSYLSSSAATVHFGLGPISQIDSLTIRWPSGRDETFHNIAADQRYRILEGKTGLLLTK